MPQGIPRKVQRVRVPHREEEVESSNDNASVGEVYMDVLIEEFARYRNTVAKRQKNQRPSPPPAIIK